MDNNVAQDSGKFSSCCHKMFNNKFLVAFLGLVVVGMIFMTGLCVGLRASSHGFGYSGRQGMMQRGEWGYGGKGGFRGQPRGMMGGYGQGVVQDQTAPAVAPSPATTTTVSPQ